MLIKSITLTRKQTGNNNSLFGILKIVSQNHGTFYFSTLENNEYKIQEGNYPLRYTWSNKFNCETLQLIGTGQRTGIRIHPANRGNELSGCIAIGVANKTDEIPNQIFSSRLSCDILEQMLWKDANNSITINSDYKNEAKITRKISHSVTA